MNTNSTNEDVHIAKLFNLKNILLFCLILSITKTWSQTFTSFDDITIAYTDEGNGLPIILIHGFINTSASFNNTAIKEQLLAHGYRVIAPDLRGNGDSDKPQNEEAYTQDAEVKDLKALLDHLKLDTVTALGYSRGSIVLAKWLSQENRINKAIIGGMGLDFTNPEWPRRIQFERAFLGLDPLTNETEGAVNYAKSQQADLQALGWSQRYQPVTSPIELTTITIPILVIVGDQDTDNGNPKALATLLPNATLTIVPGDHNTTYRKLPFATAVMSYLKDN